MQNLRVAVGQFLIYGLGSVAQSALAFVLLPLYLRFFSPDEYGVISIFIVLMSLLTLFANVGAMNAVCLLYFDVQPSERTKLIGTTWLWYFFGAATIGIVVFLNASLESSMIFHTTRYHYPFKLLGMFCIISIPLEIPFYIFRLEQMPGYYIGYSLFRFTINFVLKLYFIGAIGRGIGGYFESGIIADAITLLSILPFTLKYSTFTVSVSHLKQILKLGTPFIFSTLAIWTLDMSDRVILNYFHGEAVVGIYSLGRTLANIFNIVLLYPFALLWPPFFFSYAAERSADDTNNLLRRSLIYTFLSGGILYLLITLGCGDLLRIFSSSFASKKEYWQAASLVPLLTIGPCLYLLSRQPSSTLLLVKKPKVIAVSAGIAAGVGVGLNLMLIPRFGAFGAGLTTVIAYLLYSVLLYRGAHRLYPVKYNVKSIILGSVFLALGWITGCNIKIVQPWVSLATRTLVGVAIFALSVWFFSNMLTEAERRQFITIFSNGRRRLAAGLLKRC